MRMFRGGVPTGPDVAALMALDVGPGSVINYAAVSEVIGVEPSESRFKTVTNAWRKKLFRERRLQTVAEGGAFRVLTANECVAAGVKSLNCVGRAAGRAVVRIEAIEARGLGEQEAQQHVLLRRQAVALRQAAQDACREIAPPNPVQRPLARVREV